MLLWKCLSLNHAFLATLLASDALPDVLAALAYGILSWAEDVSKASMVHLSVLCLLLLSAEKDFSSAVNAPCPRAFTLAEPYADACAGTLADLLVAAAAAIVVGGGVRLESVLPAALAVLANITPHVKAYSAASANRLMLMLSACWDARFLLAPSRPDHLIALLDVISSAILHQHAANTPLLHSLVLNADALRARSPRWRCRRSCRRSAAGGASDFFTPTAAWLRAWKAQLPCRPIFARFDALLCEARRRQRCAARRRRDARRAPVDLARRRAAAAATDRRRPLPVERVLARVALAGALGHHLLAQPAPLRRAARPGSCRSPQVQ